MGLLEDGELEFLAAQFGKLCPNENGVIVLELPDALKKHRAHDPRRWRDEAANLVVQGTGGASGQTLGQGKKIGLQH